MHGPDSPKPSASRQELPRSLADAEITTVRVDRRSFLSRAAAVGSVAMGATLITGCPGGSNGTDSDSEPESPDSDSSSGESQ